MHSAESSFTRNIHKNIKLIKDQLDDSPELNVRFIKLDSTPKYDGAFLFIDGIVNTQMIRESMIEPLLEMRKTDKDSLMEAIAFRYIRSESVEITTSISTTIDGIVRGKTMLLIDGYDSGILVDTAEWQQRPIEQSTRQRNFQGPLIGFSEQLKVNLNLLHNMIPSPTLKVEKKQIGSMAKTDVAIVFLTDRVDQTALNEVRHRINSLDVEYVLESRVIEEAVEGNQKTIFPLSFNTELPDAVSAALFEGRIAIFTNGTPTATLVPNLFVQYFQQPSEYYSKLTSVTRILTFFSFFLTILLPGFYVAVANFHENWFPKKVLEHYFTHSDTFLPIWIEVLLLLFLLHLLGIGSFKISKEMIVLISLIATITISTTAVDAKLMHPLSLILAGITYLASALLAIGSLPATIIVTRYIFLFLGNFFGITGLCIGLLVLVIHLSRLRSVGVPYLAPIIPFHYKEFKDVFYRGNLRKLINSPHKYPHDDKE